MDKEISALEVNHTWDIVPLPFGKYPIGCKWVCRIKYNFDGLMERYKARLVPRAILNRKALIILRPSLLLLNQSLSGAC